MTTLYLIRHAEAEGNVYHFFQGFYDSLLTPQGYAQLNNIARRLESVPFHAVYTSDLYRARTTAAAVAAPHKLVQRCDPGLREMNFGMWEGRPWGEIARFYPGSLVLSGDYRPPAGGETMAQTAQRLQGALVSIVREHPDQTVAVVSHGAALRSFLGLTLGDMSVAERHIGNACFCVLEATPDGVFNLKSHNESAQPAEAMQNIPSKPAVQDLWFERADIVRDAGELRTAGQDSWLAVYGRTDNFNTDGFLENTAGMMSASREAAFFCMLGEQRVGLLLLDTRQFDEPDSGHIALVYLKPEYRHMGLGAQLIGKATVVYRAMGRKTLRLNVARRNRSAMQLYLRLGFRVVRPFLSKVSSQLVMKKDIFVPPLLH